MNGECTPLKILLKNEPMRTNSPVGLDRAPGGSSSSCLNLRTAVMGEFGLTAVFIMAIQLSQVVV